VIDRGGIRHEQAQQNGFAIGRPRRCELVGHGITGASTSRYGPTTKVRGKASIETMDSRAFSKFPSIGYAPSEYRTKPWPQEVLIEGWFPLLAREQNSFRVDGTTDSSTPAPRSLRQRNCGSRHTPLSGDRKIDHLFLTTSIYSRTRVDAGCHNNRIAGRWVIVLLEESRTTWATFALERQYTCSQVQRELSVRRHHYCYRVSLAILEYGRHEASDGLNGNEIRARTKGSCMKREISVP